MSKEKYEYLEEIKKDVSGWIKEENLLAEYPNREELEEYLNDVLFTEDSVTGNASGSYFMNAWKAEEALCHNIDLVGAALREWGIPSDELYFNAEALDVTIRCYLLGQAISEVLDGLEWF